ncbi:MAG: ATP-binding protein, partial [Chloroflexi bacterium]|nr:ATP-binding protein [Chloroflexota bacterium]MCI0725766.1 ATP-binding protein [Chloroflexota bacterium]
ALLFPRPLMSQLRPQTRRLYVLGLQILYGSGMVLSLCYILSKILFWRGFDIDIVEALDRTAFYTLNRFMALSYLAFMARLGLAAFTDASPRHRREAMLLFIGMVIYILPMYTLVGGALPYKLPSSYWGTLHLNYLLLAVPIMLCTIILRYKTFRPLPVLFTIVPLLMISALLANAQTTLAIYMELVPDTQGVFLFLTGFGLVLSSSVLWNYQSSWRGFFGRLLHWERTTLDDVKRFGEGLLAQQDLATLPAATAPALCSYLQLERAAVWVWRDELFELVSQAGGWSQPLPTELKQPSFERLPDRPLRLAQSNHRTSIPFHGRPEIEVLVALRVTAEPVGLLALGKRWDEAVFDERDLDTIALIGQQVALFLLSARQIESLRQVPQQLSEVQERERNRLAQELHDTTEQFLGRLPFTLEEVRIELRENSATAERLLHDCLAEIDQEARTLRRIRHAMAPIQLEHGFTPALERLVENFKTRTELNCVLTLPDNLEEHLPPVARLPLYRVIQQALDNIAEHAAASQVDISLGVVEGTITFQITDNGRGSSIEERSRAQATGSFGLKSMSARIQNLRGEFLFESSPGKGTTITGWLPGEAELD